MDGWKIKLSENIYARIFFDNDVKLSNSEQQAVPQDTAKLLEIIAQKDKIIEQQTEVIRLLTTR